VSDSLEKVAFWWHGHWFLGVPSALFSGWGSGSRWLDCTLVGRVIFAQSSFASIPTQALIFTLK
jgi:hypothetical protein